jgi:hypothetical protein
MLVRIEQLIAYKEFKIKKLQIQQDNETAANIVAKTTYENKFLPKLFKWEYDPYHDPWLTDIPTKIKNNVIDIQALNYSRYICKQDVVELDEYVGLWYIKEAKKFIFQLSGID